MADKYKLKLDDETRKEIISFAKTNFDRFVSQREEIDDVIEQADYMYTCAANRAMATSERTAGINANKDNRAQVGSTIFHRQVNTLAGLLYSVLKSRDDFFRYTTFGKNKSDGEDRARSANYLARWTRKKDGIDARLPEFCVKIFKEANTFVQVYWKRSFKEVPVMLPDVKQVDDGNGGTVAQVVGEKEQMVEVLADNHPCFRFLPHDMIFADRYVPGIQAQIQVVVLALRNRSDIYSEVRSGSFDEEEYLKIDPTKQWSGTYAFDMKEKMAVNRNQTFNPANTGMHLQWDVYMRVPVKDGKWDKDNPDSLHWATFVGNSLDDCAVLRFERMNEYDPDDEIPIQDVHALPDREDQLYHTTLSEIVRSAYSADSTLLGAALDNITTVQDPPLLVRDGFHRIRDFRFRKGARFHVDDVNNTIRQMDMRDATQNTTALRQQVQEDIKSALATDANLMGEYAGSRTSASEAMMVSQNTRQPHLMQVGYILHQLLPFMARKQMSYWQKYGHPSQILQITDENKTYEVRPSDVTGEFDVEVDILDEFEENAMRQQQAQNLLQVIGQNPALQNSPTHTINMKYILTELINSMRWPAELIVLPPRGVDSEIVAANENLSMLSGTPVQPKPGEDVDVHIRIHEGELARWKGLEGSSDPRARNLPILAQHLEATRNAKPAGPAGSPEAPLGNQTPGEIAGNAMAGAIGKATPQPAGAPQ